MGATNVVTSTDTAGIGYHRQGQPVCPRTITTMGDDHHAPGTLQVDVMTGEAGADPMLGYTRETKVQVTQDTPAQTAHQQRQKQRMETHARPHPGPELITPQTAVKQ